MFYLLHESKFVRRQDGLWTQFWARVVTDVLTIPCRGLSKTIDTCGRRRMKKVGRTQDGLAAPSALAVIQKKQSSRTIQLALV